MFGCGAVRRNRNGNHTVRYFIDNPDGSGWDISGSRQIARTMVRVYLRICDVEILTSLKLSRPPRFSLEVARIDVESLSGSDQAIRHAHNIHRRIDAFKCALAGHSDTLHLR